MSRRRRGENLGVSNTDGEYDQDGHTLADRYGPDWFEPFQSVAPVARKSLPTEPDVVPAAREPKATVSAASVTVEEDHARSTLLRELDPVGPDFWNQVDKLLLMYEGISYLQELRLEIVQHLQNLNESEVVENSAQVSPETIYGSAYFNHFHNIAFNLVVNYPVISTEPTNTLQLLVNRIKNSNEPSFIDLEESRQGAKLFWHYNLGKVQDRLALEWRSSISREDLEILLKIRQYRTLVGILITLRRKN